MNTCDTCKWWTMETGPYGRLPERACSHIKLSDDSEGDDRLNYEMHEGGRLFTGPKFGCIHHEPK